MVVYNASKFVLRVGDYSIGIYMQVSRLYGLETIQKMSTTLSNCYGL